MTVRDENLSRRAFVALVGGTALAAGGVGLAGCSGDGGGQSQGAGESESAETSGDAANAGASEGAASEQVETTAASNILVAFFSATGNTRRVAELAAEELDADIFEVVPAEPYSTEDLGYNDDDSRVSQERAQGLTEVELAATAPEGGLDAYDTVLLGYPIWWGGAAWPVGGFVSANDLAGKTVVPFCTSASSGAGTSGEDLVGEPATRFSSSAAEDEVRSWAAGLSA